MGVKELISDATSSNPSGTIRAVTKSDTTDLGLTKSLWVGVAGDLTVMDATGEVATIPNAYVGYHPLRVQKVMATDTLASGIVALY